MGQGEGTGSSIEVSSYSAREHVCGDNVWYQISNISRDKCTWLWEQVNGKSLDKEKVEWVVIRFYQEKWEKEVTSMKN